jgi:hypothetical protein
MTSSRRRGSRLAITVAASVLAAASCTAIASASITHLIKPASTIIPIKSYYGTMLGQSAVSPFRVQHLEVSAHRLVQSGPCVYDSNGIPTSPVKSIVDTPAGENDTYCASKPGGHTTHMFFPRGRIISNPSMNFQPILQQVGEQAANSVSLPPAGHGAPARIIINIYPHSHSSEANVFFSHSQLPAVVGTKQVRELEFRTRGSSEIVSRVWD